MFVAEDSRRLLTSPDGITWIGRYSEPNQNSISHVASVHSQFVAVGNAGAIATSPNAIDWTRQTVGTPSTLSGVAYGNGTFVAAGWNGEALVSQDGASWARHNFGTNNEISSLAFGKGLFVGCSSFGLAQPLFTSSDGITWNPHIAHYPVCLTHVTYGADTFVAVGWDADGQGGAIVTSTNGTNWVSRTVPTTNLLNAVAFGGGLFVAAGTKGTI